MLNLHSPDVETFSNKIRLFRPLAQVKYRPLPFVVRDSYMKPQGDAPREMYLSREPEVMCVGPYNSGKSYPNLMRLYWMHTQIPGLQTLILRKKKVDLIRTTLPQWENKILPFDVEDNRSPCSSYGKKQPLWYDWKNGGRTWVGNCEEAGGYLSGEYDIAFFCQAEQGTLDDWEKLAQRCDGRAGNWLDEDGEPLGQIIGDCNPDVPFHWIPTRISLGKLHLIRFAHEDNMLLFKDGRFTSHGNRTLKRMSESLTGVRYKRGYLGEWAAAEGVVFDEFNPEEHVLNVLPPEVSNAPVYIGVDFGYEHAFVCVWVARLSDGTLVVLREYRKTRGLVKDHAEQIRKHGPYRMGWADHDAENAAQLRAFGVPTMPAEKELLLGIERMKLLFREGKLLIYKHLSERVDRVSQQRGRPLNLIQELLGYSYKPLAQQTGNSLKDDVPIKKHDDAIDPVRYIVNGLATGRGVWNAGLISRRALRNV